MIYTNGKIIVHPKNNLEELTEHVAQLAEWLSIEEGIHAIFDQKEDTEHGFPYFQVPKGVDYLMMHKALKNDICMKAINETQIMSQVPFDLEIEREMNDQELAEVSLKLANTVEDLDVKIEERKQFLANWKSENNELIALEKNLAKSVRSRNLTETKSVRWSYNFEDGKKYLIDHFDDSVIYEIRDLEPEDHQLHIEHTYVATAQTPDSDKEQPDIEHELPFAEDSAAENPEDVFDPLEDDSNLNLTEDPEQTEDESGLTKQQLDDNAENVEGHRL